MIESMTQSAMSLSSAKLSMDYATSVTKMAMESQDVALKTITEMMPPIPGMGQYIDTYA